MHDHRISREMREADVDKLPPTSLAHWLWPFHWKVVRDCGVHVYLECPCGRRKVRTRPGEDSGISAMDGGWLDTGEWTPVPTSFPTAASGVWRPPRDH